MPITWDISLRKGSMIGPKALASTKNATDKFLAIM
jgi:hypothetical protein